MAGERHWGCPNTHSGCYDLRCLRGCPGCSLEAKTRGHSVREACASALGPLPRIPPLAFRTLWHWHRAPELSRAVRSVESCWYRSWLRVVAIELLALWMSVSARKRQQIQLCQTGAIWPVCRSPSAALGWGRLRTELQQRLQLFCLIINCLGLPSKDQEVQNDLKNFPCELYSLFSTLVGY